MIGVRVTAEHFFSLQMLGQQNTEKINRRSFLNIIVIKIGKKTVFIFQNGRINESGKSFDPLVKALINVRQLIVFHLDQQNKIVIIKEQEPSYTQNKN
jgi:hypothetical protein